MIQDQIGIRAFLKAIVVGQGMDRQTIFFGLNLTWASTRSVHNERLEFNDWQMKIWAFF